jgi:hypothetical protein
MENLDIRDISIIDSLPVYNCEKQILTVGCGAGRIEWHLSNMGYDVLATDIGREVEWEERENLHFKQMDILNPTVAPKPIVICSEVLEHIDRYKKAFKNLISLTKVRLIITVPYDNSYHSPDHCNIWTDSEIVEFEYLGKPYMVSIVKIRAKQKDVKMKQWCYLIVVDKRQKYAQ